MSTAQTTRVRGFAPWRPCAKSRTLLDTVNAILPEYSDYLPLTNRQIFYRLVGAHGYEKSERAYKRSCELLNRARRGGMVEFSAIRDDGITWRVPHCWNDPSELIATFIREAEDFRLDRQSGQPCRLIFAIEATGMVPLVEGIAGAYGITVLSCGGFDSTTVKHDLAQLLARAPAAEVLHIGDHDPSGVHLFSSITEDVVAFTNHLSTNAAPVFTRLAVTPEQIVALGLPTAPAKVTDRRAFEGETTQVEAIPPDAMVKIIRDAIADRIDQAAYDAVLAEEDSIKAQFRSTLIPALRQLGGTP
jgi:hypothetical protein